MLRRGAAYGTVPAARSGVGGSTWRRKEIAERATDQRRSPAFCRRHASSVMFLFVCVFVLLLPLLSFTLNVLFDAVVVAC